MIEQMKTFLCRKKQPTLEEVFDKLSKALKEGHIKTKFAEVNDSVKYIATMNTHELLWMNDSLIALVDEPDWKGKKCHNVLQDIPVPCSFCTNNKLTTDGKVIQWVHVNEKLNKVFLIRDFAHIIEGVPLRFENAIDITDVRLSLYLHK
jgi:hypothetical protein